ncbi:MAG: outer membrane lipoprotein-sorting protein [Gammaproteobacteria bacterium]|nr:outer membrane lipoprotein-sorting protein [Gammaproteobacteria bacterium]
MKTKTSLGCVLGLMLAALAAASAAAPGNPDARDIMEKNFYVTKVRSLRSDTTMLLINDRGQTRERKTTTLSKLQANGVDSSLVVKFLTPADIKGTGFLQIEHIDGDDDQWIYLPALKKSRRLVANNKKDSFVGSDFSYGDILLPKVDAYRHTLLRSEAVDGQDCYVIESVPKDETEKRNSGYSKKVSWIRRDNFLETRVEYYDVAGRPYKTQTATAHKLVEPDTRRWIALRREMINLQTGHKTVLTFDRIEVGIPVADGTFTTRSIERE